MLSFIIFRCPELRLPTDYSVRGDAGKSDSSGNSGSRVSAYDNVTNGASPQSHLSDDDTQVNQTFSNTCKLYVHKVCMLK